MTKPTSHTTYPVKPNKPPICYVVICQECGTFAKATSDEDFAGNPITIYLPSEQSCCDEFVPMFQCFGVYSPTPAEQAGQQRPKQEEPTPEQRRILDDYAKDHND